MMAQKMRHMKSFPAKEEDGGWFKPNAQVPGFYPIGLRLFATGVR